MSRQSTFHIACCFFNNRHDVAAAAAANLEISQSGKWCTADFNAILRGGLQVQTANDFQLNYIKGSALAISARTQTSRNSAANVCRDGCWE